MAQLAPVYGRPKTALKYRTPFQLLVATILSAQTTDKQVNKVTPALFKQFSNPQDFAEAPLGAIEAGINSIGLFRSKARNIQAAARMLLSDFDGKLPRTIEEMIRLPGVGRKTANVVLGEAFDIKQGVCVDTHIGRLSHRIGLSKHRDPGKIERDLMRCVPQRDWRLISHVLILHGRALCSARKPNCPACQICFLCLYKKKTALS